MITYMCRSKKELHPHFDIKMPYSKRMWKDTTQLIRESSLFPGEGEVRICAGQTPADVVGTLIISMNSCNIYVI